MEDSRLQQVDPLYGPGTVCGWLLTICAVFVSWTLNKSTRRKDDISLDLILALLFPVIAAGHILFLVSRLPHSVAKTITSSDVQILQYGIALEAPLNICETFSWLSIIGSAFCAPWWNGRLKLQRQAAIIGTRLLNWGAVNLVFAMAMSGDIRTRGGIKLTRPYVVFSEAIFPVMLIASHALLLLLAGVILRSRNQGAPMSQVEFQIAMDFQRREGYWRRSRLENDSPRLTKEQPAELDLLRGPAIQLAFEFMFSLVFFFTPLLLLFFGSIARIHGIFLIPKSNGSMKNLDQILALMGGFVVLLHSTRAAFKSWEKKPETLPRYQRLRQSI